MVGEGGEEEGEHLGSVKSDSAHVAWLDVLTGAPLISYLAPFLVTLMENTCEMSHYLD